MAGTELLADPQVSRMKFEREVSQYRELAHEHVKRGWFLLEAHFPEVFIVFAARQLKPPIVTFGAVIDFTNYDFWPPSVILVDPFTREPYMASTTPVRLLRIIPGSEAPENFLASDAPDRPPFFCIPGIREYHSHPAHSGDSWLLHRGSSEGSLMFILNSLYSYGVAILKGFNFNLQISVSGFQVGPIE